MKRDTLSKPAFLASIFDFGGVASSKLGMARRPQQIQKQDSKNLNGGSFRWWMKSGFHQLRLVVFPIIYKVLHIPAG